MLSNTLEYLLKFGGGAGGQRRLAFLVLKGSAKF
jgi:hypothetical protein